MEKKIEARQEAQHEYLMALPIYCATVFNLSRNGKTTDRHEKLQKAIKPFETILWLRAFFDK